MVKDESQQNLVKHKLRKGPQMPRSEELEGEDKASEQKYLRLLEKRQEIDRRIMEVLNQLQASCEVGELVRNLIDAEKEKRTQAGV